MQVHQVGQAKDGGLQAALHDLADVKAAFVYGECAADFQAQLSSKPFSTQAFSSLEDAFGAALATAEADSLDSATILLAPAAASSRSIRNKDILYTATSISISINCRPTNHC